MSHENVRSFGPAISWYLSTGQFTDEIVTADFVWDMSNFHGGPSSRCTTGLTAPGPS
jgi:hypothetical protein